MLISFCLYLHIYNIYVINSIKYIRQGEESKTAYLILNGRIRTITTHSNGKCQVEYEYGHGDTVGLVGSLANYYTECNDIWLNS